MSTLKIKVHLKGANGEWRDAFTKESFDSENAKSMKELKELLFELMLGELHSGASFQIRETTGASYGSKLTSSLDLSSDDAEDEEEKPARRSRKR